MVQKKYLRKGAECKVTFELPADNGVETVNVLGDFNNWEADALPMKLRKKDRVFTATANLPAGQAYQFRYLVDGEAWLTDQEADGVKIGPYGEPNSVVEV
ncbi:MAG: isoamylase early set domain-containing protein [Anaerolineae bacterium]